MATTTEVRPLTEDELKDIELPEYEKKYIKPQPKYKDGTELDKNGKVLTGREFSASGPKAELVVKYVMKGGYTRQEIASFVQCSVSRVGEVLWALDASGVEYPELLRRRSDAKPVAKEAASVADPEPSESDETEDESDEDESDESTN